MTNTKKIFFIWLILIGSFFSAYYFWYEKEVQIVTIEPEAGPTKIRPEEPGGHGPSHGPVSRRVSWHADGHDSMVAA